MQYVIMQADE